MESNRKFHEKKFQQIPFFAISKMAKNQFLNWGKSLKLPKMQFHEKKIDLFDFTSFFGLDSFKFSGLRYIALLVVFI